MSSRTIVLVLLAGAMLLSAGMLAGCEKEKPKPVVPKAPAGPNSVTSKDVQKAASDMTATTAASAATAADTARAAAKTATDAASKAADTAKAAADTAKATAATAKVAAAAAVEQTVCPVMANQPIDKNIFVEYKGKKVYFCCEQCKADFAKAPEKYIASLPQFK
jgi:hypothetical protein